MVLVILDIHLLAEGNWIYVPHPSREINSNCVRDPALKPKALKVLKENTARLWCGQNFSEWDSSCIGNKWPQEFINQVKLELCKEKKKLPPKK